jgi:hypothetical protein
MIDATFVTDDIVVIKDYGQGVPESTAIYNKLYRKFFGPNSPWAAGQGDPNIGIGYPSLDLSNLNLPQLSVPNRFQTSVSASINTEGDAFLTVSGTTVTILNNNKSNLTTNQRGFKLTDVGSFLYNGNDVNNLLVIGKIIEVINPIGNGNYSQATLEKANTSNYSEVPAYILADQDNFNYNEKANFYLLIRTKYDETEGGYYIPAINQLQTLTAGKVDMNDVYINLYKISKTRDSGNATTKVRVRADISRLNGFVGEIPTTSVPRVYWKSGSPANDDNYGDPNSTVMFYNEDVPYWVAYIITPYKNEVKDLEKGTSYVLEVDELLPTPIDGYDSPTLIFPESQINNLLSDLSRI